MSDEILNDSIKHVGGLTDSQLAHIYEHRTAPRLTDSRINQVRPVPQRIRPKNHAQKERKARIAKTEWQALSRIEKSNARYGKKGGEQRVATFE